jgi:hypothetical protein
MLGTTSELLGRTIDKLENHSGTHDDRRENSEDMREMQATTHPYLFLGRVQEGP